MSQSFIFATKLKRRKCNLFWVALFLKLKKILIDRDVDKILNTNRVDSPYQIITSNTVCP
jgi:hypothetical protein